MSNAYAEHGIVPEFNTADRLRKALHVAGVSVSEMADYLGIARETCGRYINDKQPASLRTRRLWALRTGVPFDWIETGNYGSEGWEFESLRAHTPAAA